MGSEADDLQVNPLFQAFMQSEYFGVAAKQKLIVCVPAAPSLKLVKMNKEFLQYHVIKVSPFSDEEFVTQNGKGVILKDGKVSAGKGFPRPRTVTVVFEELYYDDAFESFKLLRINFPLIGKIPLDYYKAVTVAATGSGAIPVEKRTLVQHKDVIERILGPCTSTISEHPNAFAPSFDVLIAPLPPSPAVWSPITPADIIATSGQRFVTSFNNSYVMVKGFISHTGNKVRDACITLRDEALAKAKTIPNKPPVNAYQASELQAALEQCVMAAIHKKVWNGLCELYAAEDRHTQMLLDELQHIPMTSLGVRPEIVCTPTKAIRRLQQINLCGTPFDKFNCLAEVNLLLTEAVDDAARAANEEAEKRDGPEAKKRSDQVLTTDDVLPLTTYVMIKSRVAYLQANLEYMTHFKCMAPDLNLSHLSVHLANFTGALEYINSGKIHAPATSGTTASIATPNRNKPRTDSMDDYPGSPLSPTPPSLSHAQSSPPPDLDLRLAPPSSSSRSSGTATSSSSSRAAIPTSLSASELSISDRDIGYDAYGRGPVPATLPQAAPRPSSATHSRHSSFDRDSKSSGGMGGHHHRDSSNASNNGSNGFVPPPSSKRPGRGRPSRARNDSPDRDRDDDISSTMTGLRMDDGGPASNIRPLNLNLSDDDDSDNEPVVTSTRSVSSASSSSSSSARSSYSSGSTNRTVSASSSSSSHPSVSTSMTPAGKRSTLAERSASRSSLLNRAPVEEDYHSAKASLLGRPLSATGSAPSAAGPRVTPPSSSNGRVPASSSSSTTQRGHHAPAPHSSSSSAKKEKEADLGDFLSRLRNSGDVTGNVTRFNNGGAGTRRT